MFTRKPRLQLGKIVITSAKRLLQQYLPEPELDHIGDLLAGDPPGNRRPILFQDTSSHKKPDMAARYGLLHDFTFRRSEIFGGIKDLLSCRDVITRARQQIRGASDIVEIKSSAQPDEFALGKPILFEDLGDHLKVPASRQINRIFVPALECLFLF